MEKAYAKLYGGFNRIEGGFVELASSELTGFQFITYFCNIYFFYLKKEEYQIQLI
jgi:hypothetical protein